jgi:hypothetical protein
MKSQIIFFVFIFYNFLVYSEQNNPYQQSSTQQQQPSSVQIIIHSETQSGLEQDNTISQQAKHTSVPSTIVENAIKQEAPLLTKEKNNDNDLKTNLMYAYGTYLCPVCSLTYYLLSKSFGQ